MRKPKRILAIDPGTRQMGIALIEGPYLLYSSVEVFPKSDAPRAVILKHGRDAITRMIRDFKPSILAVEKTHFARNPDSALLNEFSEEILAIGKRKGVEVMPLAPNTVKKHLTGDGRASKAEVAKIIVARYPHLIAYLTEESKWKQNFHANMFDAIAVGLVARDLLSAASPPCRES